MRPRDLRRRRVRIPPSKGRQRAHGEHCSGGVERPAGHRPDEPAFPVSVFGARHGLTPHQALIAQRLLNRADARRPIREQRRRALRLAGIISAVRGGRVGNSRWGHSMLGRQGGRVMALHGLHILRANLEKARRRKRARSPEAREAQRQWNARSQAAAQRRWGLDPDRPSRRPGDPDWLRRP